MYGWIHTSLEKFVLTRFGEEVWAQIKEIAGCEVKNGDWIRYQTYSDDETFALFGATCKILNVEMDYVLEVFGEYFMEYVRDEGYMNMLTVLGSTLREWLTNVNDLHSHLRSSLPNASFPEFWCVDDEEASPERESMILHYYSQRGSVLAALNVGLVKEVARFFFKLKVEMIRIATQDEDGSQFTSWRVIVLGPAEDTNLPAATYRQEQGPGGTSNMDTSRGNAPQDGGGGCPFGFA